MAKPYANDMKETLSDTLGKARDRAEEVSRNVQEKIDEQRRPAADRLESAASALHEKAGSLPGGEKVAGMAHGAANTMRATADYVRDHDVSEMASGVGSFVRRYPAQALLSAAAIGFLIGRSFRSDD
jgi:ElaB/YqjD/DUF883 family membrane-anchored ribosome-binding protein